MMRGPVEVRLNSDEHGAKPRRKKAGAKFDNLMNFAPASKQLQ
jgi:hypothetical protein